MFNPYGLLARERDIGYLLGVNLASLRSYADRFQHAVELVDYVDVQRKAFAFGSPEHRRFINWKFIAVESGVIATYNAFECLRQVEKLYPQAETIRQTMDENLLKAARATFNHHFPDMNKSVRTGIAHGAPAHASVREHQKHLPHGGPSIVNMLSDRTIQSTLHGGAPTFTVNQANASAIADVATMMNQAFDGSRSFTARFNSADQYDKDEPIVFPQ